MADKYQAEVVKSLHSLHFGVRADITERFATGDEPGRADLMVVMGGLGCYIENKTGSAAFDFSQWRDNQRQWWQEVCVPTKTPYFLCIFIGDNPPNYDPEKYRPRRAFLVLAEAWLEVEAQLKPYQNSLPYRAGKGYKTELQEQGLDAEHLLTPWALRWQGGGLWGIPQSHLFHRLFLSQKFSFDYLKIYGEANSASTDSQRAA